MDRRNALWPLCEAWYQGDKQALPAIYEFFLPQIETYAQRRVAQASFGFDSNHLSQAAENALPAALYIHRQDFMIHDERIQNWIQRLLEQRIDSLLQKRRDEIVQWLPQAFAFSQSRTTEDLSLRPVFEAMIHGYRNLLNERQQFVLRHRFNPAGKESLESISQNLSSTKGATKGKPVVRETVRQIEMKAIRKILGNPELHQALDNYYSPAGGL